MKSEVKTLVGVSVDKGLKAFRESDLNKANHTTNDATLNADIDAFGLASRYVDMVSCGYRLSAFKQACRMMAMALTAKGVWL